jgi:hypothetical protein
LLDIFTFHPSDSTDQNPEETFHKFYTCYFAKYFNLPADQAQPQLTSIVDSTVKEFLDQEEKVPTHDCLQWICDDNLQWKRSRRDGLEIWAYFAEKGSVVDSWEGCYQDEVEEMKGSNYSVHEAGGLGKFLLQ